MNYWHCCDCHAALSPYCHQRRAFFWENPPNMATDFAADLPVSIAEEVGFATSFPVYARGHQQMQQQAWW